MLAGGRATHLHTGLCSLRSSLKGCPVASAKPLRAARPARAPCGRRLSAMARAQPLQGKTIVVTGANRGIGLEFARQLAAKGNTVVGTARRPDAADALKQVQGVILTQLDVADPDSIQAWARDLGGKLPGAHVDVVINNAGTIGSYGAFESVTADDMLECFRINTVGPLLVTQQLWRAGLIGRPGTLVANVTSKVGSVDDNSSGGGYAYRASKSALNIVNKSLSIDLAGEGVTAVLLHPGWVRTDMTRGSGLIDAAQSAAGLIGVLESGRPLNGRWYDYAGKEIPW